ncbi:MAG: hypothetical protein RRX93_08340 [Bacteroidales bacterium]
MECVITSSLSSSYVAFSGGTSLLSGCHIRQYRYIEERTDRAANATAFNVLFRAMKGVLRSGQALLLWGGLDWVNTPLRF